jgi:hypothetical protein
MIIASIKTEVLAYSTYHVNYNAKLIHRQRRDIGGQKYNNTTVIFLWFI